MKDFVIRVNNSVLYFALAFLWILGLIVMFTASFLSGLGTLIGGTLIWCIISGFWFVQSATYEELRKLNAKG